MNRFAKSLSLALATLIAMPAAAVPALADHRERYAYEHDYDYEEEYEYKGAYGARRHFVHDAGGPPPWAPAHGYRRKHGRHHHYYDDGPRYLDFDLGRCNRQAVGSLLGGAAGAAVGSQIGDGRGQLVAIATGAIFGTILGSEIGRSLDEADRYCTGAVLEHAPDGERIVWNEPRRDVSYAVTPRRTFQADSGRYCREYQTTVTIGGRAERSYGTACRQPDGSWQIVD